ncbi:MAG: 50S ribosomal protein L24 [Bacteroidales bacterium]|nr:50S ribosomal protein L24 [Bacteroidales bacterium]
MSKVYIKKGDLVVVIAGDDKNQQGKVLSVDPKNNRAIVEGLNMMKKHVKPSASNPQGGIVEKEASIHISNLALIDPESGKATRIRIKVENGKKVRVSTKSGKEVK